MTIIKSMINWGVLGLGRMGVTFSNAISETTNASLKAVASKSGKKIQGFENLSYEELIKNKNIDAIYISTLNNTHIDLIKKIIKQGKKILCEKPASLNLESLVEVEDLLISQNIKFYEAIAYYSHPQTLEIMRLINSNKLGEIKSIESEFGFKTNFKPDSRLFNKSLGGGAIFDLGCYPISFFMLFAEDHNKINFKFKSLSHAKNGVDDEANLVLNYDNKFDAKLKVSFKSNLKNYCKINCTNGYIKINEPWLPNHNTHIEISINEHYYVKTINSKFSIYANQIQNVSESFLNNDHKSNLFDIKKSINNMKIISKWLRKDN